MKNDVARYRRLIDLLIQRTREEKLDWAWDRSTKTCKAWFGDHMLQIAAKSNENFEELFQVTVINALNGEVLEYFDDEYLAGPKDFGAEFESYFKALDYLYTFVARKATGADVALDTILQKLESGVDLKEDVPF